MFTCKHFPYIQELVSPTVYNYYTPRYGEEFIWSFFDKGVLKDLDTIRKEWGSPITINDWSWGGKYIESGLRCNKDDIVERVTTPYLSGHILAKAFDLKPKNRNYKEFAA